MTPLTVWRERLRHLPDLPWRWQGAILLLGFALLLPLAYWQWIHTPRQRVLLQRPVAPPPSTALSALQQPLQQGCALVTARSLAQQYGLNLLLSPLNATQTRGPVEEVSANLLISGPFQHLHAWLVDLEHDRQPIVIDRLQIHRIGPQRLDMQARLRCLRFSQTETLPCEDCS